jgi:elongation factor Ts
MGEMNAKLGSEVRNSTGAGFVDWKNPLIEANGSVEKVVTILKPEGAATAVRKIGREPNKGIISFYIHGGSRIGVLLELNCKTDFVPKNSQFNDRARDICMHIAAASPLYISRESVPRYMISNKKEIANVHALGKPQHAIDKIAKGKLDKWYQHNYPLE